MLEPSQLWAIFAILASLALVHMMRRRQVALVRMLQEYVNVQVEWAQKRAKAAQLARRVALSQAPEHSMPHAAHGEPPTTRVDGTQAADMSAANAIPLNKEKLAAVISEQIAAGS